MASGPLATGIISAIRALDEPYRIIGLDTNDLHVLAADVDERILSPRISDPRFVSYIRQIITETQPDLFWPLHDDEMPIFAAINDLGVPTFLPDPETFAITQDKMTSIEHYERNGVAVPKTLHIDEKADLEKAFTLFGGDVWLRAQRGAGGKGALRTSDIDDAVRWLDLNRGWGEFTAAEVLTGADCMAETIWNRGELIFAHSRTRPDGTPGLLRPPNLTRNRLISGAPVSVLETAIKAIKSVSEKPHGMMFVDQKLNSEGVPHVTEVNTGRFSTGGSFTWHEQGFNPAGAILKIVFGEDLGFDVPQINPFPVDTYKISGQAFPTMFLPVNAPDPLRKHLEARLASLPPNK